MVIFYEIRGRNVKMKIKRRWEISISLGNQLENLPKSEKLINLINLIIFLSQI